MPGESPGGDILCGRKKYLGRDMKFDQAGTYGGA
jgi:hypothetical protein